MSAGAVPRPALLFRALFGLMGVMLADPIVAMIKVALEQKSQDDQEDGGTGAAP